MAQEPNPPIGVLLRGVTWLEVLILAWAGGGLLLYPPVVNRVWPWALTPFNTRFLGALYLAALVAAWLQARSGRWSPSRVVTSMIFVFTLIVTVYSFVHIGRFDFGRVEVWIWFGLYVGVCVNAGAHLWHYRDWPRPHRQPDAGRALRPVLWGVAVGGGAYGMALLVAPEAASAFWPWRLDTFHAHLYSVTFLTPAAGAWVLLRGATPADCRALGATLAGWGALPLLGLVLADQAVHRVNWGAGSTWAWILWFAAFAAAGGWIALAGRADGTDPRHAAIR